VVHRDIKPSNLWLTQRADGTPLVKVLDFGISKFASTNQVDPTLTQTQAVFGSPTHMSPEQIRSSKKVDHRTDVWALGVVLHELLTARLPFEAETVSGTLAAIAADAPTPLCSVRSEAPADLERAILRCLEKDVSRRCSLAELAVLLRPFGSPVGIISSDRTGRIGIPAASLFPPPTPASSHGVSSQSASEEVRALAVTEQNLGTSQNVSSGGLRSKVLRVLAGIGGATLLVGLGAFAVKYNHSAVGGATSASASPVASVFSASAPPSSARERPALVDVSRLSAISSAAPVASATPSATAPVRARPLPTRPSKIVDAGSVAPPTASSLPVSEDRR